MDFNLRYLERRWKETGADEDFLAYFNTYLRQGKRLTLYMWGHWIPVAKRQGFDIQLPREYFQLVELDITEHLHNIRPRRGFTREQIPERSGYYQPRKATIRLTRTTEPAQRQEMPLIISCALHWGNRKLRDVEHWDDPLPVHAQGYLRFYSNGDCDSRIGGIEYGFSDTPNEFKSALEIINYVCDLAEESIEENWPLEP